MGYTLELWALKVADLESELAQPTLDPAPAARDDSLPAGFAERWPDLAGQVADIIASGGGEIAGMLSVYVHAVVRELGAHYGALDHTSNGGDEFRRRFLPGPAAARFGRQAVANLLNRPIALLSWGDYPTLGWLCADEAAQAAARPTPPGAVASADVAPLRMLERAIERAGALGVDLVGAYG